MYLEGSSLAFNLYPVSHCYLTSSNIDNFSTFPSNSPEIERKRQSEVVGGKWQGQENLH